jgi:hypothetical protein
MRSYKGIICGDISEFESYHPATQSTDHERQVSGLPSPRRSRRSMSSKSATMSISEHILELLAAFWSVWR